MSVFINRICVLTGLFVLFFLSSVSAEVPSGIVHLLEQQWDCVEFKRGDEYKGLCITEDQAGHVQPWLLDVEGRVTVLQFEDCLACTLSEISLSQSERSLAVILAEEGHEVLYLLDARATIALRQPEVFFVRGIYPGSISIVCWQEEMLVLRSDQDLMRGWHQSELEGDIATHYLLDPITASVRPVTEDHCSSIR
ncbi:MAG: hypothetical protein GY814_18665 [Gammaproteobacteria bacterium]|nr:hypothetical protein [Gammaproteobacteria bacterium]